MSGEKIDYRSAGVDIDAGNNAVDLIKEKVKSTFSNDVLTGIGSFGSLFNLCPIFSILACSIPIFTVHLSSLSPKQSGILTSLSFHPYSLTSRIIPYKSALCFCSLPLRYALYATLYGLRSALYALERYTTCTST